MALHRRRVLVADDEPQVRLLIKAFLAASQFDIVEAGDGVEAWDKIDGAGGSFDLLITDIKMPRMDGIALARSVARAFPAIPVLFVSGYPPSPVYPEEMAARWEFLGKPFAPKALMQKIDLLLPAETPWISRAGC